MASLKAFSSLGGAGYPGLFTMEMASDGHPVAQTAHPKHLSRSTSGISLEPMTRASGGASFKAGLAGRAQIRIKPGLKTRIESQTGFGLLKGHLNSNAMPAVTIAEKFHTFFHVLAHVDKTGFLRSIQNPLASSLLIILAPSLSMAYCPIGPNSIQTSLGMPWRSSPRKSAAWRQ